MYPLAHVEKHSKVERGCRGCANRSDRTRFRKPPANDKIGRFRRLFLRYPCRRINSPAAHCSIGAMLSLASESAIASQLHKAALARAGSTYFDLRNDPEIAQCGRFKLRRFLARLKLFKWMRRLSDAVERHVRNATNLRA
jgi:hypothetical protein